MSLTIKNAVIHVLNRDANEPLLNEFELEINDDIYTFLEKHINKALNDDESRKARFKEGMNIIKEVCFRMANEEVYFLEGSKEIARQLFKAMKTNSSISSTDLIVCNYETDNGCFIAVLKMDYTTSFIHDIEMVDDKFKISIKKQEISLPSTGQKIQKCAFIRAAFDPSHHDLIILDNQINAKDMEEPVAQFFLQTFLSAELILDNKACTKIFKKETENWIRAKVKEGENSAEEVRNIVNQVIRDEDEIDLNTFSEKAFGTKQYLKEDFVTNMKDKGMVNEKFSVDKEWVDKKLSKIRLKTDSNIEVVLEYEDFNNRDKFEVISNSDGTKNIIIKNVISMFEK